MNYFVDFLQGVLSFGFGIINFLFVFILAFAAGMIATFKRRNGFLWGVVTFFFPLAIFIVILLPKSYPKFRSYIMEKEEFKGRNPVIASIMALSAMIAKSDGVVTKEDISLIKNFVVVNFKISYSELNDYGDAFNYGKNHRDEYGEFARIIRSFYRKDMLMGIAYLFLSIAMSDGKITQEEESEIKRILLEMGISEYEYFGIKNYFMNRNSTGNGYYGYSGTAGTGQSSETLIKKYSDVLGVSADATIDDIKKAYRQNVKEYHPDKMASKGLPDEYVEFAKKKMVEINEAYDYLKEVKSA